MSSMTIRTKTTPTMTTATKILMIMLVKENPVKEMYHSTSTVDKAITTMKTDTKRLIMRMMMVDREMFMSSLSLTYLNVLKL
jgi:hypothetical protein